MENEFTKELANDKEALESMKPHKTWFIQRGDGFIFAAREGEAWDLMRNRTNWMRRDFKIIGTSDGTTYHKILKEGQKKIPEIQAEIDAMQKDLGEYASTERNLKFKELVDDNDERMIKLKGIKKKLSDEIYKKLAELNKITTNLHDTAFNAELEIAKLTPEMPTNQDIITPSGNRDKILKSLI